MNLLVIKTYLLFIIDYLNINNLCQLSQVSKLINNIVKENKLYNEFTDYYKKYTYMSMVNIYTNGYFEILKYYSKYQWFKHFLKINPVLENGHDRILKWFIDNKYDFKFDKTIIYNTIRNNHLNILILIYKHSPSFIKDIDNIYVVCRCGHLEILKWYHSINFLPIDQLMLNEASTYGHRHIVKFLMTINPKIDYENIFTYALLNGHIQIIKELPYTFIYNQDYVTQSLSKNSRAIYDWYKLNQYELPIQYSKEVINSLIKNKFLDIFWEISIVIREDNHKHALKSAIKVDDLNVFYFLYQKHLKKQLHNNLLFNYAVKKNKIDFINWFINNITDINFYEACRIAFENQHDDLIIWFVENSYIDPKNLSMNNFNFIEMAIQNNSIYLLNWFIQKSYNDNYNTIVTFDLFKNNNIKTLKYLFYSKYGLQYSNIHVYVAILNNNLELIQWLYSIDHSIVSCFSQEMFYRAITKDYIEMVKWLLEFEHIKIFDSYFRTALLNNSNNVIKWFIYLNIDDLDDYICISVFDSMDICVLDWMENYKLQCSYLRLI